MDSELQLGVNVDHVATIRQARGTFYPDPVEAALAAVKAGADGITIHLREDRRHIQERDVRLLGAELTVPMNLEMAATTEMLEFALHVVPEKCCIVPEKRQELTTEGGLDVCAGRTKLAPICAQLGDAGIEVSLFIDPVPEQIAASAALGVPVVELHTGAYGEAQDLNLQSKELDQIAAAAHLAASENLRVNAGHGLNYGNVARVASIVELAELNIGHSIVARALFTGFGEAVHEMKQILRCVAR